MSRVFMTTIEKRPKKRLFFVCLEPHLSEGPEESIPNDTEDTKVNPEILYILENLIDIS